MKNSGFCALHALSSLSDVFFVMINVSEEEYGFIINRITEENRNKTFLLNK